MKRKLLEILACPECFGALKALTDANEIIESKLTCQKCTSEYPVTNGIPRFVKLDNYASSFGYQWNLFRKEQIDSHNGTNLSAKRFWAETGWDKDDLKGKWILDAGCGAGRFLDVSSSTEAEIVGIDISNAIDAAQENLKGRENIHFVQASIYKLPFKRKFFDCCYCIGVIQHTPNPEESLRAIADMVRLDGKIAVTIYERKKWYTKMYSKYWIRPFTRRMSKETLLKIVRGVMPVAFPVTDILFRVPALDKIFAFLIPIANYVHEEQLNRDQRYAWAILDTFDMLSPQFDLPMKESDASKILFESGVRDISRQSSRGLNLVGKQNSEK